jgi:hypothetical protein
MPIFYGRFYIAMWFGADSTGSGPLLWLETLDAFGTRCLRGVRFLDSAHRCSELSNSRLQFEEIRIDFGKGAVKVAKVCSQQCCKVEVRFDEARNALIEQLVQRVDGDSECLKAELIQLVKRMYELNGRQK